MKIFHAMLSNLNCFLWEKKWWRRDFVNILLRRLNIFVRELKSWCSAFWIDCMIMNWKCFPPHSSRVHIYECLWSFWVPLLWYRKAESSLISNDWKFTDIMNQLPSIYQVHLQLLQSVYRNYWSYWFYFKSNFKISCFFSFFFFVKSYFKHFFLYILCI